LVRLFLIGLLDNSWLSIWSSQVAVVVVQNSLVVVVQAASVLADSL
jgi:hypothetical protein